MSDMLSAHMWPQLERKVVDRHATRPTQPQEAASESASNDLPNDDEEAAGLADTLKFERAAEELRKRESSTGAADDESDADRRKRHDKAAELMAMFAEGVGLSLDEL